MKYDTNIVIKWFAEHGLFPEPEYRFEPKRRWRSDFYFKPDVLLEVEGGAWVGGRHNRGSGFLKDMEKYNAAALLGFRVLRTTPQDLCTMETIEMLKSAISGRSGSQKPKNNS